MYIPPSFNESDMRKLHDAIEQHSFATVISKGSDELTASHLPLLVDRDSGPFGRLIGHFARANSHWQISADQSVLAIFHGPHAYVSPGWIEAQNVVPTWNYIAVHAHGKLRVVEDRDRLREIVQRTVEHYEAKREQPWFLSSPEPEYIDKLLAAIVGFEIEIERLEGKWKLSQNHPIERRQEIVQGLRATGKYGELQIASLMDSTT